MSPDDIKRIADHVALTLWELGARDPEAVTKLAAEFAPVAYRSLAEAMRSGETVPMPQDEAQQCLVWQEETYA